MYVRTRSPRWPIALTASAGVTERGQAVNRSPKDRFRDTKAVQDLMARETAGNFKKHRNVETLANVQMISTEKWQGRMKKRSPWSRGLVATSAFLVNLYIQSNTCKGTHARLLFFKYWFRFTQVIHEHMLTSTRRQHVNMGSKTLPLPVLLTSPLCFLLSSMAGNPASS